MFRIRLDHNPPMDSFGVEPCSREMTLPMKPTAISPRVRFQVVDAKRHGSVGERDELLEALPPYPTRPPAIPRKLCGTPHLLNQQGQFHGYRNLTGEKRYIGGVGGGRGLMGLSRGAGGFGEAFTFCHWWKIITADQSGSARFVTY